MDNLIKHLASSLVDKLNQLEEEINFTYLTTVNEDIANEGQLIHEEIIKLKTRLQEL